MVCWDEWCPPRDPLTTVWGSQDFADVMGTVRPDRSRVSARRGNHHRHGGGRHVDVGQSLPGHSSQQKGEGGRVHGPPSMQATSPPLWRACVRVCVCAPRATCRGKSHPQEGRVGHPGHTPVCDPGGWRLGSPQEQGTGSGRGLSHSLRLGFLQADETRGHKAHAARGHVSAHTPGQAGHPGTEELQEVASTEGQLFGA